MRHEASLLLLTRLSIGARSVGTGTEALPGLGRLGFIYRAGMAYLDGRNTEKVLLLLTYLGLYSTFPAKVAGKGCHQERSYDRRYGLQLRAMLSLRLAQEGDTHRLGLAGSASCLTLCEFD